MLLYIERYRATFCTIEGATCATVLRADSRPIILNKMTGSKEKLDLAILAGKVLLCDLRWSYRPRGILIQ